MKGIKRRRYTSQAETIPARRKGFRISKDCDPDVKVDIWPQVIYEFVDETTTLCSRFGRSPGTSDPPLISSHGSSPSNTATDESMGAAETPASSVCTDIVDRLDPRMLDE